MFWRSTPFTQNIELMFGDWAPVLAKSQHVPHFGQRLGSGLVGIIVFQCSITCLSCTFHSINLRVKTQCFLRSWELNRWKPSRCLNTVSKTFKFPKTLLYVILAQVRDIYPIKTLIISTHPFPCKNLHWVGLVTVDNALQTHHASQPSSTWGCQALSARLPGSLETWDEWLVWPAIKCGCESNGVLIWKIYTSIYTIYYQLWIRYCNIYVWSDVWPFISRRQGNILRDKKIAIMANEFGIKFRGLTLMLPMLIIKMG